MPEPDVMASLECAVVPYNKTFATHQIKKHSPKCRIYRKYKNSAIEVPERRPQMPPDIKKLVYHGQPIGTTIMYNALTKEQYFKFNGMKDTQVTLIAEYLICIPTDERKDIVERMLMNCRVDQFQKILHAYQDKVSCLANKNNYRIEFDRPIVCDQVGVIH